MSNAHVIIKPAWQKKTKHNRTSLICLIDYAASHIWYWLPVKSAYFLTRRTYMDIRQVAEWFTSVLQAQIVHSMYLFCGTDLCNRMHVLLDHCVAVFLYIHFPLLCVHTMISKQLICSLQISLVEMCLFFLEKQQLLKYNELITRD